MTRIHTAPDTTASAEHYAAIKFDLKRWRGERLGRMKQRPEYQSLPSPVRDLVDYMVRRHESQDLGIITAQAKLGRAKSLCRQTVNDYLGIAVKAGVLTVEKRWRGIGTKGGRSTNIYRLNEALISGSGSGVGDIAADIAADITGDSVSSTTYCTTKPLKGHYEVAGMEDSLLGGVVQNESTDPKPRVCNQGDHQGDKEGTTAGCRPPRREPDW